MSHRIICIAGLIFASFGFPFETGPTLNGQEKEPATIKVVRKFGADQPEPYNTHRFLFSPEVVADAKDGTVRLAHSVLLTDEMGATDHHQTEVLSDRVWAKKVFWVPRTLDEKTSAELFFFGGAKKVQMNGKTLEKTERLGSTGWTRAAIPASLFKWKPEDDLGGHTEFVLSSGGSLLVELHPRPIAGTITSSSKSTDGGRSWFHAAIGTKNGQPGEYLVRLRVGQYPLHGWAMSPVFDLWAGGPTEMGIAGKVVSFKGLSRSLFKGQQEATNLFPFIRTGSTPTPNSDNWTRWVEANDDYSPDVSASGHRWAQLKFEVFPKFQVTPRIPRAFEFTYDFRPDPISNKDKLTIVPPAKGPRIASTSVPFVYQEPSPRLKLLRERYQLDKVIAPGKTELEQLMLLRYWVRNQWHTAWKGDAASWMPPWDAHIILESKDQSDCLTMCTHYAAVFTQCCLALGWNARHCILDHHCVAEVWVDQLQKWVMMDAGNSKERADVGLHFERNGIPMSALELHLAYHRKKTDGIKVCFTPAALAEKIASLCRPAPEAKEKPRPERPDVIPLEDLTKYPVCQLNNYRRYAFPARNDYLNSLLPGELYQGWSQYFYDGYWWVGDSRDDPKLSPEYSRHLPPDRPQDIDWTLNWTRIHVARTAKPGEVQVDLETFTPNFARFERATSEDKWQPVKESFNWKLEPGKNVLRVRSVNRFDRPGAEARLEVTYN